MLNRISTIICYLFLWGGLTSSSYSALMHDYTFNGSSDAERAEDKEGSLDLFFGGAGTETFAEENDIANAIFDPSNDWYMASGSVLIDDYTVSIWFRTTSNTATNQHQSMFSTDTPSGAGVIQIDSRNNRVTIDVGSGGNTNVGTLASFNDSDWNLLTFNQTTYWINGGSGTSINTSRAINPLEDFAIGINRNRVRSGIFEVAQLSIYDLDTAWTDAMQDMEFELGPEIIPERSSGMLTGGLFLLCSLFLRRRK